MSLFEMAKAMGQARPRQKRLQPPPLQTAPKGPAAGTVATKAPTPAKAPKPRPTRALTDATAQQITALTIGGPEYDELRRKLASAPQITLADARDLLATAWSTDPRNVSLAGM